MPNLDEHQAYAATYAFLSAFWERTRSDDLAGLLGSMSTLPDGRPADEALWDDWTSAVELALAGKVSVRVELE